MTIWRRSRVKKDNYNNYDIKNNNNFNNNINNCNNNNNHITNNNNLKKKRRGIIIITITIMLLDCMCVQRRLRSTRASAQSDQFSLCAWRRFRSLANHCMPCEDSDQTARRRRLISVFAGSICSLLGIVVPRLICIRISDETLQELNYSAASDLGL